MRLIKVIGFFLLMLFITSFLIAVASNGVLKSPDAGPLRTIVMSGAVLFSALAAWLKWKLSASPEESKPHVQKNRLERISRTTTIDTTFEPKTATGLQTSSSNLTDNDDDMYNALRLSPVVVSRSPRTDEDAWTNAKSWIGGKPKIGDIPWPRDKDNMPLVFAGQFSLSELAEVLPNNPLPKEGSLAFFFADGGLVYVPDGTANTPTEPPSDARAALDITGEPMPENPSSYAKLEFPRWPVEFTTLEIEKPDAHLEDYELVDLIVPEVASAFNRREYHFSAKQIADGSSVQEPLFFWHGVMLFAEQLKYAYSYTQERLKKKREELDDAHDRLLKLMPIGGDGSKNNLTKAASLVRNLSQRVSILDQQLAGFPPFSAAVDKFSAGKNPWSPMLAGEIEAFSVMIFEGWDQFEEILIFNASRDTEKLKTATILAMLTGDETAYYSLPEHVRSKINSHYLLPSSHWHQMFGVGASIQENAALDNIGNHLLLQLFYDDMVSWAFGDIGTYQFWMSPVDIATKNWSNMQMTFEGG